MESRETFSSHHQHLFLPENCYPKLLHRDDEFTTLGNINHLSSSARPFYHDFPHDHHQLININGSSSNPFYEGHGSFYDPFDPSPTNLGFDFYETKPFSSSSGVMLPAPLTEKSSFPVIGGAGIGTSHHSPIISASLGMAPPIRSRLMFPITNYREILDTAGGPKYRPPDEGSSCTTAENGGGPQLLLEGGGSSSLLAVAADAAPKRVGKGKKKNKYNVVKGQWTLEEDRLLVQLVERYGVRKWSQIAQLLNGRIGKQCRERWHNHLRPDIKKDVWSEEEDKILIDAHTEIGNKWAEIAKRLPGRTENSIKNHWNATKRRQFARRKCRSKYPRQSSLLQEYIKSLNIEKINAGCRKKTTQMPAAAAENQEKGTTLTAPSCHARAPKGSPLPPPPAAQPLPASQGSSPDMVVPEYDFSEVPEFNFDANIFEESSMNEISIMDEINYGRHEPFGNHYSITHHEMEMPPFDASLFMNLELKKELDLVEMTNRVNL